MITIKKEGNTTIRVATGGTEYGEMWTVYPYFVPDPTFQRLTEEQRKKGNELRIEGVRKYTEDLSGRKMDTETAEAIARTLRNIESDRYKDLGMVVNQIDISPDGGAAKILDKEYGIRSIESEAQTSSEVKH